MATLGLQSPLTPFPLHRTPAVGRSHRDGADTIAALKACLVRIDRMSLGADLFDHGVINDATKQTTTTSITADERCPSTVRRRLTPKQQLPNDRLKRYNQDLPNRSAKGDVRSLSSSAAAAVDSGHSGDSSDKDMKDDNSDGSNRHRRDVDRRLPKCVTFADEKGQRLATFWPLEGRTCGTNRDDKSERQHIVSLTPDHLSMHRTCRGLPPQTTTPQKQHQPRRHLASPASVRLVSNCDDVIVREHPGVIVDVDDRGGGSGDAKGGVALRSRRQVALESISVDVHRRLLIGSILVRASSSISSRGGGMATGDVTTVFVRVTTNDWKTQADVPASYRCRLRVTETTHDDDARSSFVDVYVFELPLRKFKQQRYKPTSSFENRGVGAVPSFVDVDRINYVVDSSTKVVEFAVAAVSGDGRSHLWDNNGGSNYRVQCFLTQQT